MQFGVSCCCVQFAQYLQDVHILCFIARINICANWGKPERAPH